MPEMNGIELLRAAAQLRSDLPALLITGYGRSIDSRASVGLNIRDIVHKPFTIEALAAAIDGALSVRN